MKIESFEKACELKGYDPTVLPDVSKLLPHHQKAQIADYKLAIISEASWGDKKPDYNNTKQYKWAPYFYLKVDASNPSGFRFFGSDFDITYADSDGGPRFCFPSESDSDYHGQTYVELYRDFMASLREA